MKPIKSKACQAKEKPDLKAQAYIQVKTSIKAGGMPYLGGSGSSARDVKDF